MLEAISLLRPSWANTCASENIYLGRRLRGFEFRRGGAKPRIVRGDGGATSDQLPAAYSETVVVEIGLEVDLSSAYHLLVRKPLGLNRDVAVVVVTMATDVTNEITNFSHNHTITSAESPAVRRPVTLNLNLSTPIGSSVRSPRSPGEAFRVVNTENMRSVDISFQNLSYSVKTGIRRGKFLCFVFLLSSIQIRNFFGHVSWTDTLYESVLIKFQLSWMDFDFSLCSYLLWYWLNMLS